jgi:hypothetical protein
MPVIKLWYHTDQQSNKCSCKPILDYVISKGLLSMCKGAMPLQYGDLFVTFLPAFLQSTLSLGERPTTPEMAQTMLFME